MNSQVVEMSGPIGKEEVVRAPIPGKILKVCVKPGDSVKKGDILLILEAMKMENEIFAPISGVVKEVRASTDTQVEFEDALVILAG
jgi:glutaconyl-CoA decarboxylase